MEFWLIFHFEFSIFYKKIKFEYVYSFLEIKLIESIGNTHQ